MGPTAPTTLIPPPPAGVHSTRFTPFRLLPLFLLSLLHGTPSLSCLPKQTPSPRPCTPYCSWNLLLYTIENHALCTPPPFGVDKDHRELRKQRWVWCGPCPWVIHGAVGKMAFPWRSEATLGKVCQQRWGQKGMPEKQENPGGIPDGPMAGTLCFHCSAWGSIPGRGTRIRVVVFQSLSHVRFFVSPWTTARQAFLPCTVPQSLLKLMSIQSVMPSNHFVLYQPFLLLPSIFLSIRVF